MFLYTDDMDVTDRADHDRYGLALHAEYVEYDRGDIVPIATASALRRFIGAWAGNDRNGTFDIDGIVEGDGALKYVDAEGNDWLWCVVGMVDGAALYRIDDFGTWYA